MATTTISATHAGEQRGFTQVPNDVLYACDISYGAKALYSILLSYCWNADTCYPSYDTLMQKMQRQSQALSSFLKELATHGLITIIRRGQGKTNLYQLNDVVQPIADPPPEPSTIEEKGSSLKIKEPALWRSKREEYEENKYTGRYLSSDRIGTTSGERYVNIQSPPVKQQSIAATPHQPRVEQYKLQSSTTGRNIEEIEKEKTFQPASRRARLERDNTLDMYDDIQRGVLLEYITDFAQEFADLAPLTSSTTRAYNLFRQSGVSLERFIDYLYSARLTTKERTANIRKLTDRGLKTKMAYFFAVLEDRLGLRTIGHARTT